MVREDIRVGRGSSWRRHWSTVISYPSQLCSDVATHVPIIGYKLLTVLTIRPPVSVPLFRAQTTNIIINTKY